jgi:hypothetical protein
MATVVGRDIAPPVRQAAIYALAEINTPDTASFLVAVMNDTEYDIAVRRDAAIAAGRTRTQIAEEQLLTHLESAASDIRAHALVGLVVAKPERYIDVWFTKLMDPNEHGDFRKHLSGLEYYIARESLITHRDQLYECLNAVELNGRPLDKVRKDIWLRINEIWGDEPQLILTTASPKTMVNLRHPIKSRIMMNNPYLSVGELERLVDERLASIVRVYETEPEEQR